MQNIFFLDKRYKANYGFHVLKCKCVICDSRICYHEVDVAVNC